MEELSLIESNDDGMDKSISFRDLPAYDHNPFIESILDLKIKKKTVSISRTPEAAINEKGEYIGDKYMIVKKKVDKEEFVKVFKDQLTIIFELTKTAQKMLTYFIKVLGVNKDFVVFDKEKAKLYSGLSSKASIYAGLSELIQKQVIAKSNLSQIYFINPAILFNGDRLVVINAWERNDINGNGNTFTTPPNWPYNEYKAIEQ
jgi:hypothetical protein